MLQVVKKSAGFGNLQIRDVPIRKPGKGEAIVKIRNAAICGTDMHLYTWNAWAEKNYGNIIPFPLGHEFCGIVEEVGDGVDNIKVGDRVSAETHIPCHSCDKCLQGRGNICDNLQVFSKTNAGCFSEYTTVPAECLVKVPASLTDEEASLLEPFGVAVYAVDTAQVSGKSVLIQGCGPIGLMMILTAKALGASRVFAVDANEYRVEFAKRLGADAVFNPLKEDVASCILKATDGIGVRSICEITGNISAIETGFKCIAKGGRYVFVGLPSKPLSLDVSGELVQRELNLIGCYGRRIYDTWHLAFELISTGKVDLKQVYTDVFRLDEFDDAFKKCQSLRCGKVLFDMK